MSEKLYYVITGGCGEAIRTMLFHAKIEYDDCGITQEEFIELKSQGFFPPDSTTPIWQEGD